MKARSADESGVVDRDGVRIHWDRYGDGPSTILLLPTWSIIHSEFWKAQVGYLARHLRVVTFDGRGCGRSGRPADPAAYTCDDFALDAVAVLDAAGVDRAVAVGLSLGAAYGVALAAEHPPRVSGLVAIGPGLALAPGHAERDVPFDEALERSDGWAKDNLWYWRRGPAEYLDFLEFFAAQMYPEPHSTKAIEDFVGWGLDVEPETLIAATTGLAAGRPVAPRCSLVRCPVLVVHGDADRMVPLTIGHRMAELTGGRLVTIAGGGHGPMHRDPVVVNRLIKDFATSIEPATRRPAHRTWVRAAQRPRRALYLSSSIGLGHVLRDVAIANELRRLQPDLQIDWLAQHPVTSVLVDRGEHVHPASAWLANESEHMQCEADGADEHDLHVFQAIRNMDEILVNNFMVFNDVVTEGHYDVVIGDEAWDVDHFLHENPELKHFEFAWMTDFVGWLPMPDGGERESFLTADYNAEMIEQRARYRRLRDRSIFVGDPDDIVPDTFGPGLPAIREWTEANFEFAGYITGFEQMRVGDRDALRDELGYRSDERVCIVTVGGSGVGGDLLRRVIDAIPATRRLVDDVRFVIVCGPRIDPASLPRRKGVSYRSYVPNLHRHLAACDLAVVQGGLTTCMELTAHQRPFVYVPLRHHFEQNFHVHHRLQRYGAGRRCDYDEASDPDGLAKVIADEIGREVDYLPVDTSGAARAAASIAELVA
ncbi:alpha/beta fold hydrolase [Desertimonas flava]|uniref:alpha/beta fold hydrolase n=1 Tax=Desertimonas flava TaxID=2064846 RepID=UPI000E343F95|nr:alpha/beta fold hydrolase [Desertimonas flava]